ncbi:MAG: hypothetical protein CV087_08735 [Candidatus Brocadia sp. WS118]|nr:MAG: hypothetical protein CV087_08735 [Candidatus Brocadia sp. WS118]
MQQPDTGTQELRKHYDVEESGENKRKHAKVINHPLDMYLSRGLISHEQFYAGCRLYANYEASHAVKSSIMLIGRDIAKSTPNNDLKTSNFEAYRRAMNSLNRVSRRLAELIIIEGRTLIESKREFNWSARNTGIDRFRELLDDLISFYETQ